MIDENTPDLSEFSLLVVVPVYEGKLEAEFYRSLRETEKLLESYGAKVYYLENRHCADIHLARNMLFGAFRRHEFATHMIMIDSDMDWNPKDVAYMLMLKRDLIAAAGPRKRYPIDFAFQLCDDQSREIPLYHEVETNVAEVSGVGAAFMMISKDCANKMVASYPDLEWDAGENHIEHAVFDPLLINVGREYPRRRLSDDYAFCHRWRKIGGKVEVMLDVELGHTGAHRFSGRLLDTILTRDPSFNSIPDEVYGEKQT